MSCHSVLDYLLKHLQLEIDSSRVELMRKQLLYLSIPGQYDCTFKVQSLSAYSVGSEEDTEGMGWEAAKGMWRSEY